MSSTGMKILATAATGGRNEVRFFESPFEEQNPDEIGDNNFSGGFKHTYTITDFSGGVQTLDFSYKSNRLLLGTSKGMVCSFKLKLN
jgi:hypothetical protein